MIRSIEMGLSVILRLRKYSRASSRRYVRLSARLRAPTSAPRIRVSVALRCSTSCFSCAESWGSMTS